MASVGVGVNSVVSDDVVKVTDFLSFTAASVSGTFFFPKTFTFIYGQPFPLIFQLTTNDGSFAPVTAPGSATSDFSDTLVLSALNVVDSEGQPVNGVTFSSLSGTRYSVNGVVPEPPSWILLLSGILGLMALRIILREHVDAC